MYIYIYYCYYYLIREEMICEVCRKGDNEYCLLLCDNCNNGYHTYCLGLQHIPTVYIYIINNIL